MTDVEIVLPMGLLELYTGNEKDTGKELYFKATLSYDIDNSIATVDAIMGREKEAYEALTGKECPDDFVDNFSKELAKDGGLDRYTSNVIQQIGMQSYGLSMMELFEDKETYQEMMKLGVQQQGYIVKTLHENKINPQNGAAVKAYMESNSEFKAKIDEFNEHIMEKHAVLKDQFENAIKIFHKDPAVLMSKYSDVAEQAKLSELGISVKEPTNMKLVVKKA